MSRNGVTRISTPEMLRLAQRLTDRDRMILSLVDKHRVLTTPHITQAAFDSQHTAAQRLRVLTGLGLLARFRPRRERGSAPWHYVLDAYGWLDANPNEAVKVALTYDGFHPAGGEQ
jgi:hypothetical protein